MRRHWSQRVLALLGAVWFILIGIEPAVFGACPAHQPAGIAAHAGHSMSMPMGGSAMAHHDADAPAGQDHQCTCPGSCCGPSVATAPGEQPAFSVAVRAFRTHSFVEYQYRASWADFVLPFATAPPQRFQA